MMEFHDDPTWMHMGILNESVYESVREACRRFGAEKIESVYCEVSDHIGKISEKSIPLYVLNNCGIEIDDEDVACMKKIVEAERHIKTAVNLLKEAIDGKSRC